MCKTTCIILSLLFCAAVLAGCGEQEAVSTEAVTTVSPTTVETEAPTAPSVKTVPADILTEEYNPEMFCLRLQPTETTTEGEACIYYIPADQASWLAAYESAIAKENPEQSWKSGDRSSGIWIRYRDDWRELLDNGDLICVGMGRIFAEDAVELNTLCQEALHELNWKAPVRPEQIKNIRSATLEFNGTHPLTDPESLQKIESILSNAKEIRGGTNCWFTALLTLELETGETLTLSMATDSCASCLSQGVYYDYGSDNASFFTLFGIDIYAQ